MTDGPQKETEVLIHGRLYDVGGFTKHPGGSIIKFYHGHGDATQAYVEFHERVDKARMDKYLASFPSRPAPATVAAQQEKYKRLDADLEALRKKLHTEGWFDPSYVHAIYRVLEIVAMNVLAVYLSLTYGSSVPALAAALVLFGIASGRCGWLMHEAGHHSMFGNPIWLEVKFQEALYGIGCGMSGGWWRIQHNKHHATPQKLKHDVDLDTLPLVAFDKTIAALGRRNPISRFIVPYQAYIFTPVICSLVAFTWKFFLHPRFMLRRKKYFEAFSLVVRYASWAYFLSLTGWSLGFCLAFYALHVVIGGSYIFTNFAVSHTHLGTLPANKDVHWLEYASVYTMNCGDHFFTNWWMGYLNFQIEHHIFPSMPQYRFPQLSPQIKHLFESNGLKYDSRGYFEAVSCTFKNLDVVAHTISHPG